MTRSDPAAWLADLVRRVPVLAVDLRAAQAAGDGAQVAYATAMRRWRDEAAVALSEMEEAAERDQQPANRNEVPDAFARVAASTALLRLDAAE